MKTTTAGVVFAGSVAGAAAAGAAFNPSGGATADWYRKLEKSPLNPPDAVFGPVWTVLYGLIGLAGFRIWRTDRGPGRTRALRLWGLQLVLNAAWSPLFFGAKRPAVALADLGGLLVANAALLAEARKLDRTSSGLLVPYLAWCAFAAYLNAEVVRRNRAGA